MSNPKKKSPPVSEAEAIQALEDLRQKINAVDQQLLALLNERAALCLAVGRLKSVSDDSVFKPFREKEVLERLVRNNTGALPEEQLRAIYREILSSSRMLQQPQKAVYLGPEGTFSYYAGVELLGSSTDFEPCPSLQKVFATIAEGDAALGIIPLENALQGSVGQNLDLFLRYDVYIQAEIYLNISHHLISAGGRLDEVRTIYSHPRAIEQCTQWLERHLPEASVLPVQSTAVAVEKAGAAPTSAAIGHRKLAEKKGLTVLAAEIEDMPDNWTRFIVIGAEPPIGGNRDKTSILFSLPDRAGALGKRLTILAQSKINMKKLESRPVRTEKWQYLFFADVECDLTDEEYAGLKQELGDACHTLQILGSYPAGSYKRGI